MPAFKPSDLRNLQGQVDRLHLRMAAVTTPPELSHQDVLDLFAPVEHHDLLWRASDVARLGYGQERHLVRKWPSGADVCFRLNGSKSPLLPREFIWNAGRVDLIKAIDAWVTERQAIGITYGRVCVLLNRLDRCCNTPEQVRYLWPGVLALLNLSDDMAALTERLQNTKAPSNIPNIPVEVRRACRSCAGAVAAALLLSDPEERAPEGPVSLSFTGVVVADPDLGPVPCLRD